MNSRVRNLIVPVAILFALAPAATARASGAAVLRDCAADGTVGNGYSQQEYKDALNQMPADLADYSDCRAIIASKITGPGAKASSAKGGGGSGGSGAGAAGGSRSVAAKKKAARRAAKARKRSRAKRIREIAAAQVPGGDRGGSGGLALQAADSGGSMPLSLVLALVALGLLALAGGVLTLQRRSTAFASALRRVPIPRRNR